MWWWIYPHVVLLILANTIFKVFCNGNGSLIFLIDDTSSMGDDIDKVKESVDRITRIVKHENSNTAYALMPPMFQLDDYEECLQDPAGLYCTADLAMVSDKPSPLLTMMQEFSAHFPTHYNHTLVRRGICITQTCKKFYDASGGDLGSALEACANETFYNKYKLKARVSNDFDCSKREKNQPIDYVDIAVGVVCVAILVTNIVASICNCFFAKAKDCGGLRFLYCFSILRNWDKLMAPAAEGREPRLQVLKGLHGFRALNMVLVIMGHSITICVFFIENSEFVENMFIADPMHILLNGTVIIQTFLLISSFLLVYNWLIHSEKHEPSWKMLPKLIMMRWLRLTPSYAVILALTATWFGRLTSGPYWQKAIGNEMSDCRRDWWKHLLYINNYSNTADSECMVQSWYLAADTQLYYMAAIIFLLCRTPRSRKVVLSLLFALAVVVPTLHTYYQNLDGVLIIWPEFALSMCKNSPTFDIIYTRGHTNMIGYVIGMAIGYWFYEWQKAGGDPKTFRKYRFLYWTLFPLGCLCCYSGTIFYTYSPQPSLIVNLLYAAFMKPVFTIIVGAAMVGVIIQFEGLYRTILEWPVWTVPSRLSFSAYLLHIAFLRNYMAWQPTTVRMSVILLILGVGGVIISSFVAAFFFCILVEGPFGNVIRECFTKPEPDEGSKELDIKKETTLRNQMTVL